jgi:outer membrane protein
MARRAHGVLALAAALALAAGPARAQDSTAAAAFASTRVITLAEAIEHARLHAPDAIRTHGNLRTNRASVRSAYAAFIPSLSVSAGATHQLDAEGQTRIENGQVVILPVEPWSSNIGMSANLSLFEGGSRFFRLREARAGLRAAEADAVTQQFTLEETVQQAYYEVLAARESEAAAQSELETAEQQFRVAALQVRAGRATKSDSLRGEIQVRNARVTLFEARDAIIIANFALARAIAFDTPVTAAGDEPDPPVGTSLPPDSLLHLAENGPAVRAMRAQLDAAKAARLNAWTDYLPSVSAGYSRSGSGSSDGLTFNDAGYSYASSMRFSLSFPIFDQLGREEQVVRASVAEANAGAALRDATLGARESLARVLGTLRSADERFAAQTASVEAAEEDLRVQQQRYERGSGTLLDLLASQSQLNSARDALIRARYDRRIARAQLATLIGREP